VSQVGVNLFPCHRGLTKCVRQANEANKIQDPTPDLIAKDLLKGREHALFSLEVFTSPSPRRGYVYSVLTEFLQITIISDIETCFSCDYYNQVHR